ncbi:uncharacterized protein F5147DRAFT_652181 [Suillus discolor]|uniref:Fungal-type protein kinase domain-containing protein n=1 Tax=Suillus discolor TaxID=1912936 RepID=A0A9P7JUB4_9AGAM|nr:uncharacterized protein F5147DRAFT_652181 [Suillus discolor]KAG2109553.1 hypothetical protein F5147DRAFT_652181 [Suillus discolor]
MIGDDGSGTHGMLIDWEFTVKILKNESYTVGGTISLHLKTLTDERELKGASSSRPYPPPLIKHCYQDNLESMFYVFIWICIEFRGPLGMKRVLDKSHNWIPMSGHRSSRHAVIELTGQIHPYFKNLIPVVLEWYYLMRNPKDVHFNNVITLLNKHLKDLPRNKPSPGLLVSTWLLKALKAKDQKALSVDEGKMSQLSMDNGGYAQAEEEQD